MPIVVACVLQVGMWAKQYLCRVMASDLLARTIAWRTASDKCSDVGMRFASVTRAQLLAQDMHMLSTSFQQCAWHHSCMLTNPVTVANVRHWSTIEHLCHSDLARLLNHVVLAQRVYACYAISVPLLQREKLTLVPNCRKKLGA